MCDYERIQYNALRVILWINDVFNEIIGESG